MLLASFAIFTALTLPQDEFDIFTPTDADREALRDCLTEAQEEGARWTRCEGVIADPCLEEPDGWSTLGMVACQSRETDLWDAYLNVWYGEARPEQAAADLRDVQLKWIAYRDAKCALPYAIFEGGSMARPIGAGCMLTETARRATEIADIIYMTGGEVAF